MHLKVNKTSICLFLFRMDLYYFETEIILQTLSKANFPVIVCENCVRLSRLAIQRRIASLYNFKRRISFLMIMRDI